MKTRATVSQWKRSRHWAVHDGLELVAVCVYRKGARAVAELVDLANGHRINGADPIDHGSNCANCAAPLTDPDEPYCETCAGLDAADRHWIKAGNSIAKSPELRTALANASARPIRDRGPGIT